MDLATKIVGFVMFALAVAGIIYRLGKAEQRMVSNMELLDAKMDAKIDALRVGQEGLKVGQAENRAKSDEILAEVKAHTGDGALHVNTQLEGLKAKVDEEFRRDVARKLDDLLRAK